MNDPLPSFHLWRDVFGPLLIAVALIIFCVLALIAIALLVSPFIESAGKFAAMNFAALAYTQIDMSSIHIVSSVGEDMTFQEACAEALKRAKEGNVVFFVYSGKTMWDITPRRRLGDNGFFKDWLFKAYPGGRTELSVIGSGIQGVPGRSVNHL